MKALKVIIIILVVLVVLVGIGLFVVNRYVQSDDFRETAKATARAALGSEVQLADMRVSLFSGIVLQGITIANPQGFSGNLMEAKAFTLRYRLMPLLQKRVEITELAIEEPAIHLVRDAAGVWNYDKIGSRSQTGTTAPLTNAPSETTQPAPEGKRVGGIDMTLSALAMTDGLVDLRGADGKLLVKLDDVEMRSSVELSGNQLAGTGRATIKTINVADKLFARDLSAPVVITSEEIKLTPLTGALANGKVSGEIVLKTAGGLKYLVDINVTDGDVAKLLEEAQTKRAMTGRLQLTTKLAGTGGLPTIEGDGKAEIQDGQLVGVPLLELIGTLLQIPELQTLKFSECLFEFAIANNIMQTPVIRIIAPGIQISGKGAVALDDYTLNHDMTLAIQKELLGKVPKEIRAVFTPREDGYLALNFRVTGPYDAPKTDLTQRLIQGATGELLQKGIEKLLK